MADVKLSDGFVIKKGTEVKMDGRIALLDEKTYPDPLRWDPYRFMQLRGTPEENRAHLVSATPTHCGFGHGIHACPGRFFAANEIKIALAHILLKYDFKLADGQEDVRAVPMGTAYAPPYTLKFLVRRRKEELDLNAIQY